MCKSFRSHQELSNEYSLAKIDVDTAENEPLKVWRKIQFILHSPPYSLDSEGGRVEVVGRVFGVPLGRQARISVILFQTIRIYSNRKE